MFCVDLQVLSYPLTRSGVSDYHTYVITQPYSAGDQSGGLSGFELVSPHTYTHLHRHTLCVIHTRTLFITCSKPTGLLSGQTFDTYKVCVYVFSFFFFFLRVMSWLCCRRERRQCVCLNVLAVLVCPRHEMALLLECECYVWRG